MLCVKQVLVFSESLVPTVRKALCDPLEDVREAAAKTFEQLLATIGHQALDDILPALLKQLVRQKLSFLHVYSEPLFIFLFFIFQLSLVCQCPVHAINENNFDIIFE